MVKLRKARYLTMITIKKTKSGDFNILNLSDFQLTAAEWDISHKNGKIMEHTLRTLMERVRPDLITISGDLAWCGDYSALEAMACALDEYGIPYAVVWGNHDQEHESQKLIGAEKLLSKHPLFVYERGPMELGYGNYIINIEENGQIIESLIMMDTHSTVPHHVNEDGKEVQVWAKLTEPQIKWYLEQVEALKKMGSPRSALIMHIPCYAYNEAFKEAFCGDKTQISVEESYNKELWNDAYKDSFGVKHENICSYPEDDGVFDAILAANHTKDVIVGHDHVNCFSIPYKGVRLTFTVKTGAGCYWESSINGGTVLSVSKGSVLTRHELVDISHLL